MTSATPSRLPRLLAGVLLVAPLLGADGPPAPARPRQDAAGHPLRYAATGHVSNYDEAKVAPYVLPDPLVGSEGRPIASAAAWLEQRRPELVSVYEREIYGRVPATAPSAGFVSGERAPGLDGKASRETWSLRFGSGDGAFTVPVMVTWPTGREGRVPVLLHLQFWGDRPPPATDGKGPRPSENGPVADLVARGIAYAVVRYTDFEGDRAENQLSRVRRLALAPGQDRPAADEWGTIAAWAWGASRVLDRLLADPRTDPARIGLVGHSRLGKTVLWAGAADPRFTLVFASCSGEMGAALARRDWGESVDDMAANFPWQFAGNFQKYAGRWNDLPVDAHSLLSLIAPRPLFLTGGTTDQWADPRGMYLAAVAATPVYRLLGAEGLPSGEPALDRPLGAGAIGFHYHTGGHTITPADWAAFLDFAGRHWGLRTVR